MKTTNFIILALAVTLFVACSKKKDGDSSHYNNGQGRYGLTPNDHKRGYGGYYQQQMPGYQMMGQGNCQGPMFSDLVSYCGWLARDGERVCNPQLVRQTFMQYCQAFAQRYNYCVEQVQTARCYNTGCGYQYKGKWELYSHHSKRDKNYDKGGGDYLPPTPGKPQPPIYQPPTDSCNPSVDCRRKNPKKPELECRLPGESDYKYTKAQYDVLCQDMDGSTSTVTELPTTVVRPDRSDLADLDSNSSSNKTQTVTAPVQASKVLTAVESQKASDVDSNKCMNLEEIRNFIADPKNKMASYSDYFTAQLNKSTHSKAYINAWKSAIASRVQKYPVSYAAPQYKSEYTAIAANISQRDDQLTLVADAARIVSCGSKHLDAKFHRVLGAVNVLDTVSYSWNGLKDNDLEIIETIRGEFKHGNETGTYILSRYIGVGKNMSAKQVEAKVTGDMKRKGFTEIDPQAVIN